jgi:D-xylose 1-dehydrogenase (NADP+, D-xylono-1,5-lactone-forming)
VSWGVLSTARINDKVLDDRFVAIASRSPERAEAYARERGIPRAHGSYEALLADEEVDAVYIPLPNSMHVEWSIRSLEAGKHVLCEKPLSRRPDDVERAFDVAERSERILTEAFMWRHNPQAERLKQLVSDGTVGEPRVIRAAFSFTITDDANIRLAADLDGGALMDVGCYCVSGCRFLAGEPERVYGTGVFERDVDTVFAATMSFAGGVIGQFDCGFRLPGRDDLEVVGSNGSIFLDDPWHARRPVIEVRRDEAVEEIALEPVNSYRLELENLADAAEGKAELLLGREDAVAQARAIDALYRSAETGSVVSL